MVSVRIYLKNPTRALGCPHVSIYYLSSTYLLPIYYLSSTSLLLIYYLYTTYILLRMSERFRFSNRYGIADSMSLLRDITGSARFCLSFLYRPPTLTLPLSPQSTSHIPQPYIPNSQQRFWPWIMGATIGRES